MIFNGKVTYACFRPFIQSKPKSEYTGLASFLRKIMADGRYLGREKESSDRIIIHDLSTIRRVLNHCAPKADLFSPRG